MDWAMFQELTRINNEANEDKSVKITTLSGLKNLFPSIGFLYSLIP